MGNQFPLFIGSPSCSCSSILFINIHLPSNECVSVSDLHTQNRNMSELWKLINIWYYSVDSLLWVHQILTFYVYRIKLSSIKNQLKSIEIFRHLLWCSNLNQFLECFNGYAGCTVQCTMTGSSCWRIFTPTIYDWAYRRYSR